MIKWIKRKINEFKLYRQRKLEEEERKRMDEIVEMLIEYRKKHGLPEKEYYKYWENGH